MEVNQQELEAYITGSAYEIVRRVREMPLHPSHRLPMMQHIFQRAAQLLQPPELILDGTDLVKEIPEPEGTTPSSA